MKGALEKAAQKLQAAEQLLKLGYYDDTVSRAYYCAFHVAQAILSTEGLEARTHQGIVNLFGLHFVKTGKFGKEFGKYLANLKDDRENGDYEIYSAIDQETARHAVDEAAKFFKEAQRFLSPFLQ